jgi:sec-independent protein translocase protein TatA
MPGNIGWQGILIILLVLLVIFGPKRLPEMGRSLGRGIREFKDSVTGNDNDEPEKVELAPPPASTSTEAKDRAAQPESERVSS